MEKGDKKKGGGGGGGKKGKKGMMDVNPVAGTRDFPPEDMRVRNWLFQKWRTVANTFAFDEYDCPVLEFQELYKRKAGEEIVEQMYAFEEHGGHAVALRPEMTPSLARLVLQKGKALLLPIRWYSIPQCWRYEALMRGRKREHYQWNMDIWGVTEVTAEAELLAAVVAFFRSVGLDESLVRIRVSSRKLVQAVLQDIGIADEQFARTCVVVDKLDKLTRDEIRTELASIGVDSDKADRIIDVLSQKGSLDEFEAQVGAAAKEALTDLRNLFAYAEGYGYADWLRFDPSIVRGLAYYTGIVFEAFTERGELRRAICGGGRYDRLLSTYGAENIPACGFGFGDCVIMELLRDEGKLPVLTSAVQDLVIPWSEEQRGPALQIVTLLRAKGRRADVVLGTGKKMKWCYSYADRVQAERVVLIGPDEWARGVVRVKAMGLDKEAEKEVDIPVSEL